MGWVNDRFSDHVAYGVEVPKLWNRMRDSIGEAVVEFNERTQGTPNTLDHTKCMSKGKYCARVHKAMDNSSIEVYLDENSRTLNVLKDGRSGETIVCSYRLTDDHKNAEFFELETVSELDELTIPVDQACRLALEEFVFTPFPFPFQMH